MEILQYLPPSDGPSTLKPGLKEFISLCTLDRILPTKSARNNSEGVIILSRYQQQKYCHVDRHLKLKPPITASKRFIAQAGRDLSDAIQDSGLSRLDFVNLRDRMRKVEKNRAALGDTYLKEMRLLYVEAVGHFASVLTHLEQKGYQLIE